LFTAVGPEDAESLADILARRLDGTPAPSMAASVLGEEAAMRKLAKLWRMADILDDPMSDEEVERWLGEFERQEPEEKEEEPTAPAPAPRLPQVPSPYPVVPPKAVRETGKAKQPQRFTHGLAKWWGPLKARQRWNVVVEVLPPSTDGTWPKVPEQPPPGFPFTAEELTDEHSLRVLFQDRKTWDKIKEMNDNPAKRGMLQSYLLPKIVLIVGRSWWNINKRRKSLGNAPFGIFPSDEYKEHLGANRDLDQTGVGMRTIAAINFDVAGILRYYLANQGPNGKVDGYIYDALNRAMMAEIGRDQGFVPNLKPQCAYCRHKRVIDTTPPVLSETERHKVQETGSTRERLFYRCPTCAELVDTKERELRQKERDLAGAKGSQADVLAKERDELRADIAARSRMLGVPYQHLSCINENCPGQTIPLTFVDWENGFWKTPEGAEARRKLASIYGIVEPGGQKAEDAPLGEISRTAGNIPPKWLWDVPFRCPFDGVRFTPRGAFGRGKADRLGGKRMGGLLVDPPRTTIWWKPQSLEENQTRSEETRRQTGIKETTDSPAFVADQDEKLYYQSLADSLRQEFYHTREEHALRTGGTESKKRTAQLQALLYDAILEWSFTHPLHLVGYFTKRMPVKRRVIDKDTGEVRGHLEIRSLGATGAEQIVSSLIQTWFSKILGHKDGWANIQSYLTNEQYDGVPPRGYFLSVARRVGDVLEANCGLRYTKGSPLGEKPKRGSSYGKDIYLALVEGIWDYDRVPSAVDMMTPIGSEKGDALAQGRASHLDEMETHDSHRIVFDSASPLKEGSPVLVKALFMPRHTAWIPIRRIMHLRKDFEDMDEDMADLMNALGRMADENEKDVQLVSTWRKGLRDMGMPEELARFDEVLRKRLEEQKK